jgi:predicted TIM-barrel fold metal-dependent hydrolase
MALNGKLVIDAVTHAFDSRIDELRDLRPEYHYGAAVIESTFQFQASVIPEPYVLGRERFMQRMTPDVLASALFFESPTDFAYYHTIPASIWPDLSPLEVGLEVRARYPARMAVYGAVSPLRGKQAIEDLERQHEELGITAVKLYPVDFVEGRIRPWQMDDRELFYPVLERCVELGIRTLAVHKALPVGDAPTAVFRPDDVDYPARDFPGLNFEIVHGGFTFLEETAFQIGRFHNVWVNLENTSALLVRQPRRFARILGELLLWGDAKRIVWGTGAVAFHPAPLLHAFEAFAMPDDLIEQYGYPEVTDEMKADILAHNCATMNGLDLAVLSASIADDEIARGLRESGMRDPWSELPEPVPLVAT